MNPASELGAALAEARGDIARAQADPDAGSAKPMRDVGGWVRIEGARLVLERLKQLGSPQRVEPTGLPSV
jgi:hypothetical protein